MSAAPPDAAAAAAPVLRRRALLLGAANAFDYAMQFLLPVVLARTLAVDAFGQYRLLWLVLMSITAVLPLAMPQSLYFFLPRAEPAMRRIFVHQTVLYLAAAGLLGAALIGPWNPLRPAVVDWFGEHGALIPALLLLLVVSSLLDLLPTIDERVDWQARLTVSLSLLRAGTLAGTAWLTASLSALIHVLAAFALLKFALLLRYVAVTHGLSGPWLKLRAFTEQFRHAVPFGISGALYGLRTQADQWVAASRFALQGFAAFSIAGVIAPLVGLFRLSVNHAFLPSMSRLHAAGDIAGMLRLNCRANVLVAALVYPLLAFVFVYAEDLLTVVYTATYVEAAPAMRVYLVSLVALVVELASITLLLKEGVFAMQVNAVALAISIAVSWLAAGWFGLAGAAAGSVLVVYLDRAATLWRIRRRTAIPLARLQDWRALGLLLLSSVLAAALAWRVTGHLGERGPWLRLLAGAATLACVHGALLVAHGIGAGWLPRLSWRGGAR